MSKLQGRVAVITGAASGIGQALAENLYARGCRLALVDVNAAGLQQTAKRLAATERYVSLHPVDVSKREQMESLPGEVLRRHQCVDIMINNAGVALAGPFESYAIEDIEWIVNINFIRVVYSCAYFLPALRTQNRSHIVNISK